MCPRSTLCRLWPAPIPIRGRLPATTPTTVARAVARDAERRARTALDGVLAAQPQGSDPGRDWPPAAGHHELAEAVTSW